MLWTRMVGHQSMQPPSTAGLDACSSSYAGEDVWMTLITLVTHQVGVLCWLSWGRLFVPESQSCMTRAAIFTATGGTQEFS